jgi:hypothetical protein
LFGAVTNRQTTTAAIVMENALIFDSTSFIMGGIKRREQYALLLN